MTTLSKKAIKTMEMILSGNPRIYFYENRDFSDILTRDIKRDVYRPPQNNAKKYISKAILLEALNNHRTKTDAAYSLGISLAALRNKMSEYGIITRV